MTKRLYARNSTQEQQRNLTIEPQLSRLQEHAAREWPGEVTILYTDEGHSGSTVQRPAFQRMLRDLQPGDTVVVTKLDRAFRSVMDCANLLHRWLQERITFVCTDQPIDTSIPIGRAMVQFLAVVAELERSLITERFKGGRDFKVTVRRRFPGGRRPFGYVHNGDGLLVPHETEAPIVKAMFARYLEGQGVRRIRRWLNEELRLPTQRGGMWSDFGIKGILQHPVYCGKYRWGATRTINGKVLPATPEVLDFAHEPLIPVELWETVQQLYGQRRHGLPHVHRGPYLLSGTAVCGICGGAISGGSYVDKSSGTVRRYYYCATQHRRGACGLGRMSARKVEQNLLAALRVDAHPDVLRESVLVAWRLQQKEAAQTDAVALEQELADIRRRVVRWMGDYEAGLWDAPTAQARIAELRQQESQLLHRLSAASQATEPPGLDEMLEHAQSIQSLWPDMTVEEQREALSVLCEKVVLIPGYQVQVVLRSLAPLQ